MYPVEAKVVVTFREEGKDSEWEGTQRRLASGHFYFLTSKVAMQVCLLCLNSLGYTLIICARRI